MLHVHKAHKQFNNLVALNHISFNVNPGSIVGLVGPSGSGKSTLLRCIQQLEPLDTGEIDTKAHCGFMFQDFHLFPHMSVLNNLTYAPSIQAPKENKLKDKAMSLLQSLNLLDKKEAYPNQLSGGQKQRVALARSLMMSPDILLCDEPTSGLDALSTEQVISLLKTVNQSNITLIIASHDLPFLSQIATHFIVMNQGNLVADFEKSAVQDPIPVIQKLYQTKESL